MKNKLKGQFIYPKSDFAFRQLLENETVRKYFISNITGIPLQQIVSAKLLNTFLWRNYVKQKQGIVDALVELQDGTRIGLEVQLRSIKYWDKRQLFYWAKTYTKDLLWGEKYEKLQKCISIAILDFNFTNYPNAHRVYKLRDKDGNLYSELMELHTLELRKTAEEGSAVAEWIEFLNAKKEADLDMLMSRTKNIGIQEAIREVKRYGFFYKLRTIMEYKQKARMDREAEDDFVRDEGRADMAEQIARDMILGGEPDEKIVKYTGLSAKDVQKLRMDKA